MPRVSVIVPTFNRALFLKECIDSILAQTFSDFDLIVVNDGSQDETLTMLAQYSGIQVISQKNQGVSKARNVGIAAAQGEYLAFCDSDDLWKPEKLETQIRFFQSHAESLVCYTDEIWIKNEKRVNPCKHHQKLSGWIFEKCLEMCIVSPSSVMMHRSFFDIVGKFNEAFLACEDYDLWLRASLVLPFYFLPQPLIIKRGGHADQLSRLYWGMDRFRVDSILQCLHHPLSPEQRKKAIQILCKKCKILSQGACKRGHTKDFEYYQKIIATYQNC